MAHRIVLTKEGYYTNPPFYHLQNYAECGIYTVEKLTIGRTGYGSITFEIPVNIKDTNLDETVIINHKEVIVYPNVDVKPRPGRGLNCAAEVRLERVWPQDGSTSKYIKDPRKLKEIGFEKTLREENERCSATFVKYVPQTGCWIFKVSHFSKYGYSDSDDDDKEEKGEGKKQKDKRKGEKPKEQAPRVRLGLNEEDGDVPRGFSVKWDPVLTSRGLDESTSSFLSRNLEDDVEMTEVRPSPSAIITHLTDKWLKPLNVSAEFDISPIKIITMKKTFFPEEKESESEVSEKAVKYAKYVQSEDSELCRTPKTTKGEASKLSPVEKVSLPKRPFKRRPLLHTVTGLIKTALCGPQMTMSRQNMFQTSEGRNRGFRVGWGPNHMFLIITTQKAASTVQLEGKIQELDTYLAGRSLGDDSKEILQRISLKGGSGLSVYGRGGAYNESDIKIYLEKHLHVRLKYSDFYTVNNVPGIRPSVGSKSISLHNCLSQLDKSEAREYAYSVWSLCYALWGELLESVPPLNSHHNLMLRKEKLGNWISSVNRKSVLNKYCAKLFGQKITQSDHYIEDIWNLVTVHMIPEACILARKNGDSFLAILLAQMTSCQYFNYLMQQQISSWIDCGADAFIRRERLKICLLLCGKPLFTSREETINVCEDLDWKRTLGLHLWYLTSGVKTIKDAFAIYQKAFNTDDLQNLYAKAPFPSYCEEAYMYDEKKLPVLDLCYQIIELYCDRYSSMEKMFDPITHTLDVLDYSLSWLVYCSLHGIGYHHTSVYRSSNIHSSFAAQLESYGMWHWAIFVLLHIPDTTSRRNAVMSVLERHLDCDNETEDKEKECFIKTNLKIPSTWIYTIKAIRAMAQRKLQYAVFYLNKAGSFSLSLNLLMKELAPQCVINEHYHALLQMLKPLEKSNAITAANWEKTGAIMWLYLKVMTKIKYMLKHPETVDGYMLESVQVDAINLCKQLPKLAVPTLIHRLCRLDLSDRVFDLVGEFVKLQKDDPMSSRIILFMSTKLPMQDSFKVVERRDFLTKWPADFANCRLFI